jgi:hypothetical protein
MEKCHEGRVRPGRNEGAIGFGRAVDQLEMLWTDARWGQRRRG